MKSTANSFGEGLYEVATQRDDFMVCCPDTRSCGLEYFKDKFPNRGFNLGIAEQNLLDVAAGVASCGYKTYVATFAVFMSMRACEQIRQFICYPCQDVTLLSTHTGLQVGSDGGTHIAVEDIGIMRSLPNMTIVQPADEFAAKAMVEFSLNYHKPLYIRLHREGVAPVYDENYKFEFNKANIIRDFGNDVALLATGTMVTKAVEAANILKEKGIKATVVDIATIKPIDVDTLVTVAKNTGNIVTIEDHNIIGGLGSAVSEALSEYHPTKVLRIGIPDVFGESGTSKELYEMYGLDAYGIVKSVIGFLKND